MLVGASFLLIVRRAMTVSHSWKLLAPRREERAARFFHNLWFARSAPLCSCLEFLPDHPAVHFRLVEGLRRNSQSAPRSRSPGRRGWRSAGFVRTPTRSLKGRALDVWGSAPRPVSQGHVGRALRRRRVDAGRAAPHRGMPAQGCARRGLSALASLGFLISTTPAKKVEK